MNSLNQMVHATTDLIYRGQTTDILNMSDQIRVACKQLLDKHGSKGDVAKKLKNIIDGTKNLREYVEKSINPKHMLDTVKAMSLTIQQIAQILDIELREVAA
ncbi:hypothetical protein GOV04_02745 [Candidatus Woesearchaeota archaeon]|nr:hypothetical protein [Candidatus Woesearchaeota archaeon]